MPVTALRRSRSTEWRTASCALQQPVDSIVILACYENGAILIQGQRGTVLLNHGGVRIDLDVGWYIAGSKTESEHVCVRVIRIRSVTERRPEHNELTSLHRNGHLLGLLGLYIGINE